MHLAVDGVVRGGVGVGGALVFTCLLVRAILFGVSATDPATFVIFAVLMAAVSLVAGAFPRGRRRARI
jgi:hypothetical protein